MSNIHNMTTRSKKNNNDIINTSNNPNDNIDKDLDDVDEYGNIKDLIDYDCDDEFDRTMLNEELNKLRKRKIYDTNEISETKKKKSKSKKNIEDIFLSYLILTANNKLNNKKNITINPIEQLPINKKKPKSILKNKKIDDSNYDKNCYTSNSDSDTETDTDNEDDNSDFNYSEDEYDYEYEDLINNNYNTGNNNFEYFHKLHSEKKKNYINQLKSINKINNTHIPLKFKILNSNMNLNTKSIAINFINKLEDTDNSSGEYNKLEQWIYALVKIPFGTFSNIPINYNSPNIEKKNFLKNSNNILNESIYGHTEAKNNILQILAKWISNPDSQGNILALQGPMGNGKTTLVKEGISKAINRPFAFIALGGSSDVSYFDGHNFTYEGSRWGRIIDILMEMKCMNPVIYFDELDKISDTNKGDEIVHLLTHITDLTQNNCYQDKYFPGIDIDLSKVLFIFSFNDESKINRILKDRMQVIRTKGFSTDDKINITNDYLLKQIYKTYNYNNKINMNNDIIKYIIENYTEKEEGVRNLKRCLDNIVSKINMYEMLYDDNKKDSEIKLPYHFENFKLPYTITIEDIDNLLNKTTNDELPPPNMYL